MTKLKRDAAERPIESVDEAPRATGDRGATPRPSPSRAGPKQARAIATVGRILDTAAALLDEVGVEAFTTNLLAARSGERVRTVYRYFPNKHAVIAAVAERLAEAESGHVLAFATVADPTVDARAAIDRVLRGYLEGARSQPGFMAIRKAMRAVPALMEIERRANAVLIQELAKALAQRGWKGPPARLRAVATVVVETVAAVLDRALASPATDAKRLLGELATMLEHYLAAADGRMLAARHD